SYTVTDDSGCTAVASGTISQPGALQANASATPIPCSGGTSTVTVSANGGTRPYIGTGTFSHTVGNYTFTVTDANGPTATTRGTLTEPAPLNISLVRVNASCNGGSTGSIDLTVTGGTRPYTYAWNNGASTEDLAGLGPAQYTVTVTDAHGCTAVASETVARD